MKRQWLSLAVAMTAALFLSACGASVSAPGTEAQENQSLENETLQLGVDEQVRSLLPDAIVDRGYVTVALDVPYPPFAFLDEDGQTLIGADPELASAMSDLMGIEFRLEATSQANLMPGLSSGKYDIAMSGIADRYERQEVATFVDYMQNGGAFVVSSGAKVRPEALDDLCGLTISVQSATTMAKAAQEASENCDAEGSPTMTVSEFQGQDQVLLAITSGRADVAMITAGAAAYMKVQSPEEFEIVSLYNDPGKLGVAIANGNDDLIAAVEAAMKILFANGTYEDTLEKWGLFEFNSITEVTINDAIDKP